MAGVPWLGPLRTTCPMEVVRVFIQVIPVALSFTMQLVLIVATVGSTTAASCKGSGGAS